jgi:hypothetical protein
MKVTKIKLLALLVSVLVLGFGIVSLIGAEAPVEKNVPGEKAGTFTGFMRSLPGDTRVQVELVIEQNLECWENDVDESTLNFNVWKEELHRDLKLILTPAQFEAFVKLWGSGNPDKSPDSRISVSASDCTSCAQTLFKLNQAFGFLGSAESSYRHEYRDYCDYGFYPDAVLPDILKAKARVDLATQYAVAASQSCDYWHSVTARSHAKTARWALDLAISDSTRYCTQEPPWLGKLNIASVWLNLALTRLDACVNECN